MNQNRPLIDEFKGGQHTSGYKQGNYQILVTLYPVTDKIKYERMLKNRNNVVRMIENKKDVSQLTSSIHVPSVLNDTPFYKISISKSPQNVNHDSGFSFFDGGSADITDLVDRMTQLVRGEEVNVADEAEPNPEPTYTDAAQVRAENEIVKIEDVFRAHERLKEAERNYERELRRNPLTDFDKTLVDSLLRGEVQVNQGTVL